MEPTTEPTPLVAALEPLRDRLARLGIDPAQVEPSEPQAGLPETAEDRLARRAQQAANKASRWRSRLPVMYLEASLTDLDPEQQHRAALTAWLDSDHQGLILAGTVGSGKTHAAYAVANAAVARGLTVESWTVHDLLAALRPEGDPTALRYAERADLLLLDDLSVAKVSDWAQESLTALLDARLRDRRRLVVTTNLPSASIGEAWGTRALDRMMARALPLVFRGESRRTAGW